MIDHAIKEAAAKAIGQANEDNNWEGISEDYREWYRELAMCALVIVEPLIRAAALEEAGGWQTIENAPTSTKVLVGLWLSPHRWFELVAEKVPAEASNWIADSGRITLKPTHWHLLPPPPAVDD